MQINSRIRSKTTGKTGKIVFLTLTSFSDDYCSVSWDDMPNGWPAGYVTRRDSLELIADGN